MINVYYGVLRYGVTRRCAAVLDLTTRVVVDNESRCVSVVVTLAQFDLFQVTRRDGAVCVIYLFMLGLCSGGTMCTSASRGSIPNND